MSVEFTAVTTARLSANWRKALLIGFAATLVIVWVSALPSGYWFGGGIGTLLMSAGFGPLIFLSVTIHVNQAGIRATLFPIFRVSLPRDRITDVQILEASGGLQEGMGLRSMGDRTWGLVVGGPAIHVQTVSGKSWVLSTPDPARIVATFEKST